MNKKHRPHPPHTRGVPRRRFIKESKFKPTSEQIEKFLREYLERGGTITRIEEIEENDQSDGIDYATDFLYDK